MLFERFYSTARRGDMLLPAHDAAELRRKQDPELTDRFNSALSRRIRFVTMINSKLELERKAARVDPSAIVSLRVGITGSPLLTVLTNVNLDSGRYYGGFLQPRYGILTEALIAPMPVDMSFLTADCASITGYGRKYSFAIHGSWSNLVQADVIEKTATELVKLGEDLSYLSIEVGPTICQGHYEVDQPVMRPLREKFPAIADVVLASSSRSLEHAFFDIPRFTQLRFKDFGARVTLTNLCTAENGYFSYRATRTKERFLTISLARNGG